MPVDAYYSEQRLAVEYCDRQHTEAVPIEQRSQPEGLNMAVDPANANRTLLRPNPPVFVCCNQRCTGGHSMKTRLPLIIASLAVAAVR